MKSTVFCPQCGLCFFQEVVNQEKRIYKCLDCGCIYALLKLGTLKQGEYLNSRLLKAEKKIGTAS